MYKIIIAFVLAVLIIAIGIGQCNNDDSELDSEYYPEQIQKQSENSESVEDVDLEEKENDVETEQKQENHDINYNTSTFETPRMVKSVPEQILERKSYSLSYNEDTKCPNWVAWHLTSEHTNGDVSRRGFTYVADPDIHGPRQEVEDWDRSRTYHSWDHGHMCPAGDNKWDVTAMEESFLLSNFCPQNQQLNSGAWNYLEEKCRNWARQYNDIYIACGPIFTDTINPRKINNKIWIPDALYKVVLCLNGKPKSIGFIYPNEEAYNSIGHYAVTVDSVESITGIDFFYNIPDDIENTIEANYNLSTW